ncbi:uncharacterized protein LOC127853428 [Dreissena polymorpha]|uniref:uncharacterized protein LOC127853428 n=1 Tax=Dreissena polymorpha TaxID=45954 RepID=UPI002264DCED|nr:uncharacterized protein LOC127853428 [Dreissena polymorpha]
MRLTQLLLVSFVKKKSTPGLTYHGKNQKFKPVKVSQKMGAVNFLMMEEQNNRYLNNPYLTKVEEDAFGNDHPKKMEKQLAFYDMQRASRKFYSDRTLEEHIEDNLGKHRKWE